MYFFAILLVVERRVGCVEGTLYIVTVGCVEGTLYIVTVGCFSCLLSSLMLLSSVVWTAKRRTKFKDCAVWPISSDLKPLPRNNALPYMKFSHARRVCHAGRHCFFLFVVAAGSLSLRALIRAYYSQTSERIEIDRLDLGLTLRCSKESGEHRWRLKFSTRA